MVLGWLITRETQTNEPKVMPAKPFCIMQFPTVALAWQHKAENEKTENTVFSPNLGTVNERASSRCVRVLVCREGFHPNFEVAKSHASQCLENGLKTE